MDTRSYKVTSPIKFKGSICGIGATVEMTAAEAAQFAGCIELADPEENDGKAGEFTALVTTVAERDKTIENLNGQLAERESDLDELTSELSELRNINSALNAKVTDLNAGIADRDSTIAIRNSRIAELEKAPAPKKK